MASRTPLLRAAVAALAVLVATVAVLGLWQVMAAPNSQRTQIGNGELTAVRLASSAVSSSVTSRLDTLENLANLSGSATFLATNSTAVISATIEELLKLYPEFSSMSIVDAQGTVVVSQPPWPSTGGLLSARQQSYARAERLGRPSVSESFVQPTGGLAIELAAPVRNGPTGPLVGVVEATLPATALSSAVGGSALSGGGSLVIVDRTGHALTGPSATPGASGSYASTVAVKRALAGHLGTASGALPGFSGTRLEAYAPVRSLGWAVVVEDPISVLNGPVAALTERLAGIGAVVMILALGTAVLVWRLLRQLARQRDEATAVFGSVGEGVATVDAEGRLLKINAALERLVGKQSAQVEHHPWASTFVMRDERGIALEWHDTVVAEAIRTRHVVASRGYALGLETADGHRLPVAVTAAPLVLDTTTPSGAVVVLRDVSREREVDQLKSSLVSTVSHELRTPLTLIQGFSELLLARSDLDQARTREALHEIHVSSQRLGRLIDDLLSVSRIEAGRLTADFETFEVAGVITEVLTSFSTVSAHQFTTDLGAGVGPVLADRDKTVQVLTNLVSNASKYSPPGSDVQIVVRSVDNHAEVQVIDKGIGMTESERAVVFEKFSRSDRPEVRKVGGTGLGLYITKNLVEMQGGQLWLRSEHGTGTTVTFTLPLAGSVNPLGGSPVAKAGAPSSDERVDVGSRAVR